MRRNDDGTRPIMPALRFATDNCAQRSGYDDSMVERLGANSVVQVIGFGAKFHHRRFSEASEIERRVPSKAKLYYGVPLPKHAYQSAPVHRLESPSKRSL